LVKSQGNGDKKKETVKKKEKGDGNFLKKGKETKKETVIK
jgi:hypothetical protein